MLAAARSDAAKSNAAAKTAAARSSAAKSNGVTSTASDDEDDTLSYFSKLAEE